MTGLNQFLIFVGPLWTVLFDWFLCRTWERHLMSDHRPTEFSIRLNNQTPVCIVVNSKQSPVTSNLVTCHWNWLFTIEDVNNACQASKHKLNYSSWKSSETLNPTLRTHGVTHPLFQIQNWCAFILLGLVCCSRKNIGAPDKLQNLPLWRRQIQRRRWRLCGLWKRV